MMMDTDGDDGRMETISEGYGGGFQGDTTWLAAATDADD